jgi:SSS family solute:Na+ symporter
MKGVMTLSAIQTPILIIGSFLVLFLGLSALGGGSIGDGWAAMIEYSKTLNVGADGVAYGTNHMFHLETGDPLYDDYPGFWVFIGASIIGFWYWATDQHIVQRVLGQTKGESNDVVMKRARRGTIAAGYFKLLPVFMFLIPGMVAAALAARPDSGFTLDNPDTAFGAMVKFVLPAGVKGIVTIGFISALVASLAAFFNSCATLFTEDFYKPMFKGKTEETYVLVGRIATVVVVVLGIVWIPVMMSLGSLYSYLQGIQSLLAPAMVAVFVMGIFSKKITPKAGEYGLIIGFLIGMVRLLTNIFTNTGKDIMTGWGWESTAWFWQTNWLIFEIWLLAFIMLFMVVVSFFTKKPTAQQIEFITFTGDYKAMIRNSWNKWDVIASLGVVILCALFYWYFW